MERSTFWDALLTYTNQYGSEEGLHEIVRGHYIADTFIFYTMA